MEKKKYVLGFAFTESQPNQVCLILKQKPDWQKGLFNGVGGKIEKGENPLFAMVREFKEETGVFIPAKKWYYSCAITGPDYLVHCYKAFTDLVFQAKTTTEEPVSLFSLHNLPENKITNLNYLIPLALTTDVITITYAE